MSRGAAWTGLLGVAAALLAALAAAHLTVGDRTLLSALVHAGIGWWLAPAWAVAAAAAATGRRRIGAGAGAVAAAHLLWVAPGNLPGRGAPDTSSTRLGTANLLWVHPDPDGQLAAMDTLGADLWCLQELTTPFSERLERDPRWPHQHLVPDDGSSFGIGVVSRLPLVDLRVEDLAGVPAITTTIAGDGPLVGLRLACVHTVPPRTTPYARAWADQLDELGRRLAGGAPAVILGDLNATRHHPSLRALLRTATVRDALGDVGWARARTWPAPPYFLQVPVLRLDHVLLPPDLRAVAATVGAPSGSDHLAVTVDVVRVGSIAGSAARNDGSSWNR